MGAGNGENLTLHRDVHDKTRISQNKILVRMDDTWHVTWMWIFAAEKITARFMFSQYSICCDSQGWCTKWNCSILQGIGGHSVNLYIPMQLNNVKQKQIIYLIVVVCFHMSWAWRDWVYAMDTFKLAAVSLKKLLYRVILSWTKWSSYRNLFLILSLEYSSFITICIKYAL